MTPVAVPRIARIALNVADLEAACAFYTGALGFRRTAAAGSDRSVEAAILRLGHPQFAPVQMVEYRVDLLAGGPARAGGERLAVLP